MRVDFAYEGYDAFAPADVPDANVMGVYEPRALGTVDEGAVVADGFARPHGARRLREEARGRVLILVEDGTRGTPVARLLHYVLAELREAGIGDESVTLLTAQGTHREMSEAELRRKLGEHHGRFKVFQHRWLDESSLREYGRTRDGTRVTAHRLLGESDFVLGLGSVVPHRVKGFSGGAKIAFPGVSGREVQERNQWEAARLTSEQVMGFAESPARLRAEEAARPSSPTWRRSSPRPSACWSRPA